MSYNPNVPQATDFLSNSQVDLLNNFTKANSSFGLNHYSFADLTINNGKHNNVQTPLITGGVHPVTPANEDAFYGMQDSAPLGVLQYSRGPNSAVPTPVTSLQSTAAAIVLAPAASTNVLDFTGITILAMGSLFAINANISGITSINFINFYWNGTAFQFWESQVTKSLAAIAVGNILTLKNQTGVAMNNVYWTLKFYRIQP
jgi:hypothetical protein